MNWTCIKVRNKKNLKMDFLKKIYMAFKDSVLHIKQCFQETYQDIREAFTEQPSVIGKILLFIFATLFLHLVMLFIMVYPLYVATPELIKSFASRLHTDQPSIHF